jgi:hypothetical protein
MKERTKHAIILTTIMLVVYLFSVHLDVAFPIVFLFFLITLVGLCWMVVTILRDNSNLSSKTFDDHFYEDADLKS